MFPSQWCQYFEARELQTDRYRRRRRRRSGMNCRSCSGDREWGTEKEQYEVSNMIKHNLFNLHLNLTFNPTPLPPVCQSLHVLYVVRLYQMLQNNFWISWMQTEKHQQHKQHRGSPAEQRGGGGTCTVTHSSPTASVLSLHSPHTSLLSPTKLWINLNNCCWSFVASKKGIRNSPSMLCKLKGQGQIWS